MFKRLYNWFYIKVDIRRYNFTYGSWLVYSAFYDRIGFYGFFLLKKDLNKMKICLAVKYNLDIRHIKVSATLKA